MDERTARPRRLVDQEADQEQRDDVEDLDHRVDRGARRVFVGIADGVAGNGRRCAGEPLPP